MLIQVKFDALYSALRMLNPAVLRIDVSVAATWTGVGNESALCDDDGDKIRLRRKEFFEITYATCPGFSGSVGSYNRLNLWVIDLAAIHDICCPLNWQAL